MGPKLKPEEVQRFVAAAGGLFAGSRALNDAIPQQLDRARTGRDEVVGQLRAGALAAAATPEVREHYVDAEAAEIRLYGRCRDLAVEVSGTLAKRLGSSVSSKEDDRPSTIALSTSAPSPSEPAETRAAILEASLSQFDLAIAQFYIAVTLMMLNDTIETSIDACEVFLGRPVGSREIAARMKKVGEVFIEDLVAAGTKFPFLATLVEAVRQLRYNPQIAAEREQVRAATGMARVVKFGQLVRKCSDEGIDFAEGIVGTSLGAIEESPAVPELNVFSLGPDLDE